MRKLVVRDGEQAIEEGMTAAEVAVMPEAIADPVPAVPSLAFLQRFTLEERMAIREAAKSDPIVDDWLDMLRAAQEVDVASQETAAGMAFLVGNGLITDQRAQQILDGSAA